MAIPTVRAVGTIASAPNAITPGLPAGTVAGDLLLYVAETWSDDVAALTVSGWAEVTGSPVDHADASTMLHVFWKISVDGADATVSNDSGNHQGGRIIGITEGTFDSVTPFNGTQASTQTAQTTGSMTGFTTTRDDCLIVMCSAAEGPDLTTTTEFGLFVNAALSSITERIDNSFVAGNGGAIGADTAGLATQGAIGTTTFTSVTSTTKAHLVIAVQPPSAAATVPMSVGHVQIGF